MSYLLIKFLIVYLAINGVIKIVEDWSELFRLLKNFLKR